MTRSDLIVKFLRGYRAAGVLVKLQGLVDYLRVTNRQSTVLSPGARAFLVLGLEVRRGGGRIGICATETRPGIAVWNYVRRHNWPIPLPTDTEDGGPAPMRLLLKTSLLTDRQKADAEEGDRPSRDPWTETYYQERRRYSLPPPHYSGSVQTLPLYRSQAQSEAERLHDLDVGLQSLATELEAENAAGTT